MTDPVHILLVEDNAADIYLFEKALLNAGLVFELTVIEDGGQAVAFVRGKGEYATHPVPDIAIIDLNLPKRDGIEVLEALRVAEGFERIPVVVTSSSSLPHTSLEQEHLRVARYITKPPDLEAFLQIGDIVKEILLESRDRPAVHSKG
jgi:CheY-like chemotaxis protein